MELETRKCTTKGCSRTFRVLISSKQIVCSNSCSQGPYPEAIKGRLGGGKANAKPPAERPPVDRPAEVEA